jgi:spore germination cell wall hydrolase CwlJ-like protein
MLASICLALNVYFEARSEPIIAQFAVAQVTMNRVQSDAYPNTVCDVVWDNQQFSWTHDGKSDRPKEREAWETAQWVANTALRDNGKYLYVVPTDALHYHADYVTPYWVTGCVRVSQIGRHIFYRRKL